MSHLFAFNNAQDLLPLESSGHYDSGEQLWVGQKESVAAASPDGPTVKNPTGTITFPVIPDADADLDWN